VFVINIILVALNAKYIHSSLALRSIKAYCNEYKEHIKIVEFTINNDIDFILSEIYKMNPKVIGFSCYIWNINIILEIIDNLKKIITDIIVILGGPEVSYDYEYLFKLGVDIVSIGEGEQTFKELTEYFLYENKNMSDIKSIAFLKNDNIIVTKAREPVKLDDIPFAYYDCIDEFKNKIIYYEASRGCPYNCQYCLSSVEKGVRFLSIERVKNDLMFFIKNNVKQVKFVDRTFNCNKKYAVEIWNFLIEKDNGVTNFHFEISADILDNDMLKILSKARKQLFQLEIGVQSTNLITLNNIKRNTNLDILFEKVKKIKSFKNIHQHLDLIAGLPDENYISFKKSFNDVYNLYPQQLQLGFLKLLKGSGLRNDAKKFGIVYKSKAPYEVLYTKDISYSEMNRLKRIEEMVETYYNSGKCIYTLRYVINDSPFDFFEQLSLYWEKNNYHFILHNKMELYTIMFEFLKNKTDDIEIIKDIMKFDLFLNDNIKNFPKWIDENDINLLREKTRQFFNYENIKKYVPHLANYTSKQVSRMCHLEIFEYDIVKWIEYNFEKIEKRKSFILFDYYSSGDLIGNVKYIKVD